MTDNTKPPPPADWLARHTERPAADPPRLDAAHALELLRWAAIIQANRRKK